MLSGLLLTVQGISVVMFCMMFVLDGGWDIFVGTSNILVKFCRRILLIKIIDANLFTYRPRT